MFCFFLILHTPWRNLVERKIVLNERFLISWNVLFFQQKSLKSMLSATKKKIPNFLPFTFFNPYLVSFATKLIFNKCFILGSTEKERVSINIHTDIWSELCICIFRAWKTIMEQEKCYRTTFSKYTIPSSNIILPINLSFNNILLWWVILFPNRTKPNSIHIFLLRDLNGKIKSVHKITHRRLMF